jgi:hypothetical protein
MPKRRYARCRNCGALRDDGVSLSSRGLCGPCGNAIRDRANDEMHYHRGPYFLYWRRRMVQSVGGVLVDDVLNAE